jgi:hypothetical protein
LQQELTDQQEYFQKQQEKEKELLTIQTRLQE